jgi:OOP family OmpA-OmpF porin
VDWLMSDPSSNKPGKGSQQEKKLVVKDDLTELREILLAPEHARLGKLQERLDDPKLHARDVSSVLPEAILLRSTQDKKLTSVLTPTVEDILRTSVERNPKTLVNVLFPVIGPAIRKAIAETFKRMLQSLNQTLEYSFSRQGLKWRIEAWRTGKSFAEVVLLHSLVYRVEQIFLIHRQTGLMLQHVGADPTISEDADMISSMLKAIQDFAHDSFRLPKGDSLETLQVGDLTVWIEQGPQALLAGAIRGSPPEDLRSTFAETLETIHLEQGRAIEDFEGDTAVFEASRDHLESCLQAQYKAEKRKLSPFLWLVFGVLLIALGVSVFFPVRNHLRWKEYVGTLNTTDGIVVMATEKRRGRYYVYGLLDPLAGNPQSLIKEARLDPEKVIHKWEPYQALHPPFILERAKHILNPPKTVSLKLEGATLVVEGVADHKWILTTRQLAAAIPGIAELRENQLIDKDLKAIGRVQKRIDSQVVYFTSGSSSLSPQGRAELDKVIELIGELETLSRVTGMDFHIQIFGHTDRSGTEEVNRVVSQIRADNVRSFLVSKGISPERLIAVGVGASQSAPDKATEGGRESERAVTFSVAIEG